MITAIVLAATAVGLVGTSPPTGRSVLDLQQGLVPAGAVAVTAPLLSAGATVVAGSPSEFSDIPRRRV